MNNEANGAMYGEGVPISCGDIAAVVVQSNNDVDGPMEDDEDDTISFDNCRVTDSVSYTLVSVSFRAPVGKSLSSCVLNHK